MKALLILLLCLASTVAAAEKRYYWFSANQQKVLESSGHPRASILVDRQLLSFTESTPTPRPCGNWNDYRLVAVTDSSNERLSPRSSRYVFDIDWIENSPDPQIVPSRRR